MAIFVDGMACGLCGKPMEESKGQEIVCFQPFVSNDLDPLSTFSDGCFHQECFHRHPLAQKVLARVTEMKERIPVWPPPCALCGRTITEPNDHFTFGHLTEGEGHPLHSYNYMQLHLSCMGRWLELPYVYRLLEEMKRSGAWSGPALDWMLEEMRKVKNEA